MVNRFYAQPYDIDAEGFYFCNREEYDEIVEKGVVDSNGNYLEEFESDLDYRIQIIDLDKEELTVFFNGAISMDDVALIEKLEGMNLEKEDLVRLEILVKDQGYSLAEALEKDYQDIVLYTHLDGDLDALAREFVEEGYFGNPKDMGNLVNFIDYERLGKELRYDYLEFESQILKKTVIYRSL